MMDHTFTKEQIKNYFLLYGAIIVIMILFFIASKLFYTPSSHEKRLFETKVLDKKEILKKVEIPKENRKFKILEHAY